MSKEPQDVEVVPAPVAPIHANGPVTLRVPYVGTSLALCPMSLDLTTREGKALALAAGNPSDIEFDKDGIARIRVTNFVIFPEERADPETGEVKSFARTVLFDASGKTFRTTAAHAPERIKACLDLFNANEWAVGIPFVIRQRLGKAGRMYHDIRIEPLA